MNRPQTSNREFTPQLDRESSQYQQWYDFQWGDEANRSLHSDVNLAEQVFGNHGYRVFTPASGIDSVFSRILKRSTVVGDCLVWHGVSFRGRTPRIWVNYKPRLVHRLMYKIIYGDFTGNLIHTCGNRLCCRPEHLRIKRGRQAETEGKASGDKTTEPSGEALSL